MGFEGQVQDITIRARKDSFRESVNIQQENAIVFNRFDLPSTNGKVTIEAEGSGIGIAQMSICYNVVESPYTDSPFDCDLNISDGSLDTATISFCCSLKKDSDNSTGMLLYEIRMPSGFTVDIGAELRRNKHAKKVEMKKESANYYFDDMQKDQVICSTTHVQRFEKVGSNKPSTIVVQDYYQPKRRYTRSYSIGALQDSDACVLCGRHCAGCPAPRFSEWKMIKGCSAVGGSGELYSRECIDPNKNEAVHVSLCGGGDDDDAQLAKQEPCQNKQLPVAPTHHEGLWGIDLITALVNDHRVNITTQHCFKYEAEPTKMYDSDFEPPLPPTLPEIFERKLGVSGIPGVTFKDGEYLDCHHKMFGLMDTYNKGVTISMLVHVNQFEDDRLTTLFSFGTWAGTSPTFQLQRVGTRARKYLVFMMNIDNLRHRIARIPSKLFVNKWTHVLFTWDPVATPVLYVDGELVGISYSYNSKHKKKYPVQGRFCIGKTTRVMSKNQGSLNGTVASLAVWEHPLNATEATAVYQFYEELRVSSNRPPAAAAGNSTSPESNLITTQMLNFLAQPRRSIQYSSGCFDRAMSLKEMEEQRRSGNCYPYY